METVDKIKQKLDIVDLVGSYINLKKSGRNYKAVCPFHSEKTPSFMVSPELQIYKCFGCGEAGDIFSFHQKIEGVDFARSLEMLAEKAGVKIEKRDYDPKRKEKKLVYEINELAQKYYHYLLVDHSVGKKALEYLKDKRGLKLETIKEFKLGYAPDSWDSLIKFLGKKGYDEEKLSIAGLVTKRRKKEGYYDKFRGRIIFPFIGISGKVVGFSGRALGDFQPKYLNSPETPVFHKSIYVYGLDKAKVSLKQEGAVFVEGQLDVISAFQNGIKNVIASSGTAITPGQLKAISRYTNDITFALDPDFAGRRAAHRAIELAEKQGFNVKAAMISDNYDDLDDLVRKDKSLAKEIIKNAVPVYDFYLATALKRHNKDNSIEKRKLMEEIVPLFRKITDPVQKDHYIQKISEEVDVTEVVVADLLKKKDTKDGKQTVFDEKTDEYIRKFSSQTPEEYMIALLLKAPLEYAQTILYKLAKEDFTGEQTEEIFTKLKDYLVGRKKKFEIKYFIKKFDDKKYQDIVNELYLRDLQIIEDNEDMLIRELDSTFDLLKTKRTKRRLKELSQEIKQAEMANNAKELKELTKEFKELSEKLVKN